MLSYCAVPCVTRIERVRKMWEYIQCTDCTGEANDSELIPTVKMETRHPVDESFGSEILSIYDQYGVMDA